MTLRDQGLITDKGEVGGSSPPRPTIQITPVNTRLFSLFPFWGISLKKPICQLFANFSGNQMPLNARCIEAAPWRRQLGESGDMSPPPPPPMRSPVILTPKTLCQPLRSSHF